MGQPPCEAGSGTIESLRMSVGVKFGGNDTVFSAVMIVDVDNLTYWFTPGWFSEKLFCSFAPGMLFGAPRNEGPTYPIAPAVAATLPATPWLPVSPSKPEVVGQLTVVPTPNVHGKIVLAHAVFK